MSRTIPAALLTALGQRTVRLFYAVELIFDSAPLRLWTGYGTKTIDGQTFTGAGSLLQIGGLEEVADLSARAADLTLSGVPSGLVATALAEPYQGRPCRILFGVTNVSAFVEVFGGQMDTMTIVDSGELCEIRLTVESRLVTLERPRIRRYTHESQQSRHPGDSFFSFVTDLQDKEVVWGRKKA
ncbi:hypothetical protein SAMN06265173_1543 [Thalassovita litoralis]|jgi:hypothetical protein|uniref:Uncharacterized protein n=1 Tax=Thalassovita litoralis TaxID=1010611 RepID=A0A521FT98_9RHOB|nr:hypothetical protein [Thalassovita litoralis]SMO99447.1 hypothetical protein SAMN06265173_1543 [Thalassovita litoralis]